jgi:hypothetical protein
MPRARPTVRTWGRDARRYEKTAGVPAECYCRADNVSLLGACATVA